MPMQSSNLLPALQELPGGESTQHRPFPEVITDIVGMDRAMYAAEFASVVSFGIWPVFGDALVKTNIPGTAINESYLQAAYERTTLFDPDMNVVERWRQAMAEGGDAPKAFESQLKGVVAEFQFRDRLNERGYNVEFADNPYQRGYDLHGTDPDGEYTQVQVKTGEHYSTGQLQEHMERYPLNDVNHADHYAVATELYDKTVAANESASDATDRIITDVGSDLVLVTNMKDGLETLSDAMDIAESVPGAAAILAGARLIHSILKAEREFQAADRTTKNKIQVVQTLTLMSRMGITTALATAGGATGTVALPGVGTLVGGIAGAGVGMYLNRHLQPRMLDLALGITSLTHDDLFYYKNKPHIDDLALNFRTTAGELATSPAF